MQTSMKNKGVLHETTESPREFPFELLQDITDNFSHERMIGSGGFAKVYKGVLDGKEIAVKKISIQPGFDDAFTECVNLISVQHQNIVRLIGYCYKTERKVSEFNGKYVFAEEIEKVLCLEYLHGGSLDAYISEEHCTQDWSICYGIIKGICEGLKYLHTGCKNPIYHLDLKPANILLDTDLIPKIGDFGLSRLLNSARTYVTQKNIGTRGYMPPEYINKQEITEKFDVFSLGVIILQIMAGRTGLSKSANMPSKEFIEIVHANWVKQTPATMSPDTSWEVKTCIEQALRCVEDDRNERPTISEIIDILNKTETSKTSFTSEILDFRSKQDPNEQCSISENFEVAILVQKEAEEVPGAKSMVEIMGNEEEEPLARRNPKGYTEMTLSLPRRIQRARRIYIRFPDCCRSSLAKDRTRCAGKYLAGLFSLGVILVLIFFFAMALVTPKVNVVTEDARLDSFALSTMPSDTLARSFLDYNLAVSISVSNPNRVYSFTYTNSLRAAIVFDSNRLYNTTLAYEGQKHPPGSETVYPMHLTKRVPLQGLGDIVEEFKKQNATGVFSIDVRISGEIKHTLSGHGPRYRVSHSCPLRLRLASQDTTIAMFQKVNCVVVAPDPNLF